MSRKFLPSISQIVDWASQHYDLDLRTPRRTFELFQLRQVVFLYLRNKYGIPSRELAKEFGQTVSNVNRALKLAQDEWKAQDRYLFYRYGRFETAMNERIEKEARNVAK